MSRPQIDWSHPLYGEVIDHRMKALEKIRRSPGLMKPLMGMYKENWAEFVNDWMVTFDPRKINTDEEAVVPFILFPRQVEFVQWVHDRWRGRERGLAEKSRDVGFSWLAAACAVCVWLFYPNAVIGFGSRKKESVDNGDNDPDSLFWKIRKLITELPPEFRPKGYGAGNKWGLVVNPANGSAIKGEVGDGIGMGGRTTLHFVDEADALEHQQLAEASLAGTTDCRIDISTTNQVGSVYYNNRRSLAEHQVFVFDWSQDPRKRLNPHLPAEQEPWYIKKKRDLNTTAFASQILRNPNAALANTVIELSFIEEAENRQISQIHIPSEVPWSVGVDASGMGNDESVFWFRRGRLSLPPVCMGKLDGVQLALKLQEECRRLVKIAPIQVVAIERDGPGGSCADQLKYTPLGKVLKAVHTGSRVKDGRHYNFRAWLHTQAQEYLKDEDPVLPRDPTFKAQGTAILFEHKGGTLLVESKDEYRKRLSGATRKAEKLSSRSPDRWDAFVLTFVPRMGEPLKAVELLGYAETEFGESSWSPLDPAMGY